MAVGTTVDCAIPRPLSGTDCGLSGELSVTVSRPTRLPFADGLKVTTIWHDPAAEMREPQLDFQSLIAKSPDASTLEIVSAATPLFVTVTSEQVSVLPTSVSGHAGGAMLTPGAGVADGVADATVVAGVPVPVTVPLVVPDAPGVPLVPPGVPAPGDETTATVPAPAAAEPLVEPGAPALAPGALGTTAALPGAPGAPAALPPLTGIGPAPAAPPGATGAAPAAAPAGPAGEVAMIAESGTVADGTGVPCASADAAADVPDGVPRDVKGVGESSVGTNGADVVDGRPAAVRGWALTAKSSERSVETFPARSVARIRTVWLPGAVTKSSGLNESSLK